MSRLMPVLFLALAACAPAEPPLLIDGSDAVTSSGKDREPASEADEGRQKA